MEQIEYEALEPDPEDEYYDQMCSVQYARMFNEQGRSGLNADHL